MTSVVIGCDYEKAAEYAGLPEAPAAAARYERGEPMSEIGRGPAAGSVEPDTELAGSQAVTSSIRCS